MKEDGNGLMTVELKAVNLEIDEDLGEGKIIEIYQNFFKCYQIFINSLEHNFMITSLKITTIIDLDTDNESREASIKPIIDLKDKQKIILKRNNSFSPELRRDLTDFKIRLIKELSKKIKDESHLEGVEINSERAIKVANAVVDYFILPTTADNEKSTRLNKIFLKFQDAFPQITKDNLKYIITMIENEDQSNPNAILHNQCEERVKDKDNLKELKLTDTEKQIIANQLFAFHQKSITIDILQQSLSANSSSLIHVDSGITEISKADKASQTTSDISIIQKEKPESDTNKRSAQEDESSINTESLLKKTRRDKITAQPLETKNKLCVIS
jgi:hypothetical protein